MTNTFRLQVYTGHHLNQLHSHRKICLKQRVKKNEYWNTRGFSRGALPIITDSTYTDTQKGKLEDHFANAFAQVFTSCHPTHKARNIFNQTPQVFALLSRLPVTSHEFNVVAVMTTFDATDTYRKTI